MFGIFTLLVFLVLLPLSISAGNRYAKGKPLNKAQLHLFVHADFFQNILGKHYTAAWWAGWTIMILFALYAGYWGSAIVFGVYIWSRLRFQKIVARPAAAIDAAS